MASTDTRTDYRVTFLVLCAGVSSFSLLQSMVNAGRLFPPFGIDLDFIDRARRAGASAAPVVAKRITERSDEVRRMLVARAL